MENVLKKIKELLENPQAHAQHYSGNGAVYELENKLKAFYGKKYALLFNNATTALQGVLLGYGLKKANIITSPFNWGGALVPFFNFKNTLTFTKVNEQNLCLEVPEKDDLKPNTKAVFSVDFGGYALDSQAIRNFCKEHGLIYIADASQSLGAFYQAKPASYFADAIIVSFTAGKTIYGGEGGAFLTDNEEVYAMALRETQHPERQKKELGLSNYNEFGYLNGRINPFAAIIINNTFEQSLEYIKIQQNEKFNIIEALSKQCLCRNDYYKFQNISTFFNIYLESYDNTDLQDINHFLGHNYPHYVAEDVFFRPTYENHTFKMKFKGRYFIKSVQKSIKKIRLLKNRF